MVNCPLCDAEIDVEEEDLDEGEEMTCEECGSTLRVTSVDPLEIESADEDEEDDDEDLDFDEDESEDEEEEDEEEWR